MTARHSLKGYEMLGGLSPCPVCGSLEWWFDGEAWRCSTCEPPAVHRGSTARGNGREIKSEFVSVWDNFVVASFLATLVLCSCGDRSTTVTRENAQQDRALPLTLGGFLKDGPEAERVEGVCEHDYTRTVLNCDLYNGLRGWVVTEVTLAVTWLPYRDGDLRYYQVPITIRPFTTERATIRLGLQLPNDEVVNRAGKVEALQHWRWQNIGTKGHSAN
jgi:hypothetical protein